MRIKEVCEKTGLTDKSVRYYINSGLLFPQFSENYAGRKNFSFDESDVDRLNKIALLRKYNFTINDIKEMLENDESISSIMDKHIEALRSDAEDSSLMLNNLIRVSNGEFSGFDDFCNRLSDQNGIPMQITDYDYENKIRQLWSKLRKKLYLAIPMIIAAMILALIIFSVIIYLLSILFDNILI